MSPGLRLFGRGYDATVTFAVAVIREAAQLGPDHEAFADLVAVFVAPIDQDPHDWIQSLHRFTPPKSCSVKWHAQMQMLLASTPLRPFGA